MFMASYYIYRKYEINNFAILFLVVSMGESIAGIREMDELILGT
jgi:hypothetical protein